MLNRDRILEGYEDLLRLSASLREGRIHPYSVMQMLGGSATTGRALTKLGRAAVEMGRAIKTKHLLKPSNLLKHLGTYSRRNRLYQSLREIGHVIRTMVILEYITNEDEQRAIQKVTNMVESYNRFNNWFVFGERSP